MFEATALTFAIREEIQQPFQSTLAGGRSEESWQLLEIVVHNLSSCYTASCLMAFKVKGSFLGFLKADPSNPAWENTLCRCFAWDLWYPRMFLLKVNHWVYSSPELSVCCWSFWFPWNWFRWFAIAYQSDLLLKLCFKGKFQPYWAKRPSLFVYLIRYISVWYNS